ncbi:single-stranded DNA-binding protein [Nocardia vulneris]|uniref:single-stranded DNA-binding protein n=1 Tax=Nocardia vulneris TaxID=1141657 RepID=UPI00068C25C9|nr:single-stranded DNA-binding protein [Nocardia vulneris]
MSGETTLTIVGNLVADPVIRFTDQAAAVVNFTVASTPRTFDRKSNQWKDGTPVFMRCTMWRDAAENVAESLTKGARVIVTGKLQQRDYTDRDNIKRYVMELVADEVGVSLKYAVAKPIKRNNGRNGNGRNSNQRNNPVNGTTTASDDPWTGHDAQPEEVA